MAKLLVAIDPGVHTGFSVYSPELKKLTLVTSGDFFYAMDLLMSMFNYKVNEIHVYIEDARKIKFYNKDSQARAQGAGSVKRDCALWELFCIKNAIPHTLTHPCRKTNKMDAETFKKITGWNEKTNQHGRDSALIIFGK